jgi:hypothetical protein
MRGWLLLICLLTCSGAALAEPAVRVETRLQPAPPYQAGSTLRLEVDLLTTTWFTQAPQPAALDLPGTLITPPNGQADKLSENIEGTPYFGLRLTYLISPVRGGEFNIPALPFSLQLGQASSPVEVSTQPLDFVVDNQAPGNGPASQLVAAGLRIEQRVDKSATPLKVGDRIIRRVQIQADDAQAMLIPPTDFAEIPGLKRYPQPPQVSALSDGRGSTDGGQRIDIVSYVVEDAGDYTLPAIELSWWDSRSQQARTSSVPAVAFSAQAGSSFQLPFSLQADLEKLGRGRLIKVSRPFLLLAGVVVLLGLCAFLARQRVRAGWQQLQDWRSQRHAQWLASEACAWRELQRALGQRPLPLAELYRWLSRSQGHNDLQSLAAQLPTDAASSLQQSMTCHYGRHPLPASASSALRSGLQQLRKRTLGQARLQAREFSLPPLRPWAANSVGINPDGNAPTPRRDR